MIHFMVIFRHCVLAFLKMQFCKVFPRKINYFIFVRWTYGASKGAVHTLTKMMALDLSKDKIRVNSLSPTWTWTPEVAKIDPQSNFSQFNLKSRVCGGRSYNSWQFFTSHNSQCLKKTSKSLILHPDFWPRLFLKHIWEIIFKKKIFFNIFGLNLIFRKIDFFESRMKNQSTGNVYLMQWHINLDFAFAALENFRNVKTWAAQALFSKSSEKKKTKKSDPRLQ